MTSAKYQVQKLQRKTIPKEIFQIFKVILIKVLDIYCMYLIIFYSGTFCNNFSDTLHVRMC